MKTLCEAIMADYEIDRHRPEKVSCVQFGLDAIFLGLIDKRLDEQGIGVAAVGCGEGLADKLKAQDGLYTLFTRGESGETRVDREEVVQSILTVLDPEQDDEALMALARDEGITTLLSYHDPIGEAPAKDAMRSALMTRFLLERWRSGLEPPKVIAVGGEALSSLLFWAKSWNAGEAFTDWLRAMPIRDALADCLTARADAKEAARLCEKMNYQDAMIHLSEPYGIFTTDADAAYADILTIKRRLFDAGLFVMGSVGPLRGDKTLYDCMKDEPLRDWVGHAIMDEILPWAPFSRDAAAQYLIECYQRYENPMQENRLEDAARGLVHKMNHSILPAIQAYVRQSGVLPKRLTAAFSAMILLLADVRLGEDGIARTIVDGEEIVIRESPEVINAFSTLSSDMDAESLTYAVLSDRTLWEGRDLKEIEGLAEMVAMNIGT